MALCPTGCGLGAPGMLSMAMHGAWLLFLPGKFSVQTPGLLEAPTSWSAASSEQIPDTWGLCNGTKGEPGPASSL